MDITIDVKVLLLSLVCIALLILIIYLIQLTRKLFVTVDRTNEVLEDLKEVSSLAAKRSQDLDGIISNVGESADAISSVLKENKSVFSAIASVVKALASLKGVAGEMTDRKDSRKNK